MAEPQFIPNYSKPDAPGIAMNFDNTVSIYHIVEPGDTFEDAVGTVFHLLKKAQEDYPDWPRVIILTFWDTRATDRASMMISTNSSRSSGFRRSPIS